MLHRPGLDLGAHSVRIEASPGEGVGDTARVSPRHAMAALLAVALGAAACADDGDRSETVPIGTHVERVELDVDGRDREFRVVVPEEIDGQDGVSAVLVLHGGGGNIDKTVEQTRFDDLAREEHFLAVYPQGNGSRLRLLNIDGYTWNAGGCCGEAADDDVDDVAFLVAVIDELEAEFGADPDQVFATGISNGGMMAYRLACEAADRVAAVAPVSATLFVDCSPSEPVSLLHIHGLADRNVRFEGGRNTKGIVRQDRPPVLGGIDTFLSADGCGDESTVTEDPPLSTETWSDCDAGTAVELLTIEDGGHSWPGGEQLARFLDEPSDALDASPAIWDFFAEHPRT